MVTLGDGHERMAVWHDDNFVVRDWQTSDDRTKCKIERCKIGRIAVQNRLNFSARQSESVIRIALIAPDEANCCVVIVCWSSLLK